MQAEGCQETIKPFFRCLPGIHKIKSFARMTLSQYDILELLFTN